MIEFGVRHVGFAFGVHVRRCLAALSLGLVSLTAQAQDTCETMGRDRVAIPLEFEYPGASSATPPKLASFRGCELAAFGTGACYGREYTPEQHPPNGFSGWICGGTYRFTGKSVGGSDEPGGDEPSNDGHRDRGDKAGWGEGRGLSCMASLETWTRNESAVPEGKRLVPFDGFRYSRSDPWECLHGAVFEPFSDRVESDCVYFHQKRLLEADGGCPGMDQVRLVSAGWHVNPDGPDSDCLDGSGSCFRVYGEANLLTKNGQLTRNYDTEVYARCPPNTVFSARAGGCLADNKDSRDDGKGGGDDDDNGGEKGEPDLEEASAIGKLWERFFGKADAEGPGLTEGSIEVQRKTIDLSEPQGFNWGKYGIATQRTCPRNVVFQSTVANRAFTMFDMAADVCPSLDLLRIVLLGIAAVSAVVIVLPSTRSDSGV